MFPSHACGGGQGGADPPILLLLHTVHRGGPFVDLDQLTGLVNYLINGDILDEIYVVHDTNFTLHAMVYCPLFG